MNKRDKCDGCPWGNPETCGACRADKERRKLDNDSDNNKKLQKSLQKQSKEIRKTKAKNIIGKSLIICGAIILLIIVYKGIDMTAGRLFLTYWKQHFLAIAAIYAGGMLVESKWIV